MDARGGLQFCRPKRREMLNVSFIFASNFHLFQLVLQSRSQIRHTYILLCCLRTASCALHVEQVEDNTVERYCAVPQPVIERLDIKEAGRSYYPDDPPFTIVNKCRCGDVCKNESHRCIAVRSRKVTRTFQVKQQPIVIYKKLSYRRETARQLCKSI